MNEYEFFNESTGETVEVEADTFDEATAIMFEPDDCYPADWELVSINGQV